MRRKVNVDKIENIAKITIDKMNSIQNTKKKLNNNIAKILECYRGKDANLIKCKYLVEVKRLDGLTNTLDSYTTYFKWLTKSYGENFNNSANDLSSITNNLYTNDLTKNISNDINVLNEDFISKTIKITGINSNN